MAATLTSGVITINFDDNPANFLPNQSASDQLSVAVIVQDATGAFTVSNYIDVAEREDDHYIVPQYFLLSKFSIAQYQVL